MKELSIEEKAKRYDEAIKQLRTMMPNWENLSYNGKTFLQDLVHIIPELKESEDEKIRNQIIEHIKWSYDEQECAEEEMHRWISWLEKQGRLMKALQISNARIGELIEENYYLKEKQGEYAKFRDSIQVGDKVTRNQDGVLVNLSQLKRVAKPAEKQGEQKPAEEYNITGIGSKNAQGKLGKMIKNLKPVSEVLEQNFAWSEEEEKMLGVAISDTFGNGHISVSDWLKSLRPQNRWKPSDEQIEALLKLEEMHVLEHEKNQENAHLYMMVKSIREQLLKLREE